MWLTRNIRSTETRHRRLSRRLCLEYCFSTTHPCRTYTRTSTDGWRLCHPSRETLRSRRLEEHSTPSPLDCIVHSVGDTDPSTVGSFARHVGKDNRLHCKGSASTRQEILWTLTCKHKRRTRTSTHTQTDTREWVYTVPPRYLYTHSHETQKHTSKRKQVHHRARDKRIHKLICPFKQTYV